MRKTLLIVLIVLLAACSQYHDAEWYAAHPEQAQKRLAECQKLAMDGKLDVFDDSASSEDCRNAAQGATNNAMQALGF